MKTIKLSLNLNFLSELKTKLQGIGKRKLLIYGGTGLIFIGSLIGTWFLCDYVVLEYFDFEPPSYINFLIIIGVIQFWIGGAQFGLAKQRRRNNEELRGYLRKLDKLWNPDVTE